MRKVMAAIVVIVFVINVAGCATIRMESKLRKPVNMTEMAGEKIRDFSTEKKAIWLFWGLIPLSVPELDETIGPQVADRNGINKLKITAKNSFTDALITTLTQGILTVRTIIIEGEVFD